MLLKYIFILLALSSFAMSPVVASQDPLIALNRSLSHKYYPDRERLRRHHRFHHHYPRIYYYYYYYYPEYLPYYYLYLEPYYAPPDTYQWW